VMKAGPRPASASTVSHVSHLRKRCNFPLNSALLQQVHCLYSNKKRGMREEKKTVAVAGQAEPDTPFRRKCRMTWAALIQCVYEVDPLKCPKCGGEMKIVGFIEESSVIERILRRCNLWKEPPMRAPPVERHAQPVLAEPALDYRFFEQNCP
jgi:hypothetical protein